EQRHVGLGPDLLDRHDRVDPAPERDERPPRSGWRWRGEGPVRGPLGLQAQRGEVQVVAVGEFGQALEVELAEEGFLGSGQRSLAEVDDRGRGRLVVRDARQQEHQPGGGAGLLGVPARAGWQGDALGELAAVQLVAQAQHPALGVGGVVPVAEDPPARRAHRAPPGRSRATRARRPQGRAVRSLKKWRGSGPVGMPVVWIRGPGTPAWRRAWRLAAQRSSSQRPGADGSGRMNSAAAGPKAPVTASWTSGPTWYRSAPMAGPIPAVRSDGRAPRRCIAARA